MSPERMSDFAALVGRPAGRRQNPRKLSHLIERDLRGLILRGVLAPGQALPSESDLLEAFQVSRNTLREALRMLESESLIEIRRGRAGGAVVRRPHARSVARYVSLLLQMRGATVADIQEVRLAIEPPGAAKLVELSPDDLQSLTELHQAELSQADDPLTFLRALAVFEQSVFELSGSKAIAVLSSIFRDIMGSQRFLMARVPPNAPVLLRLASLHAAFLDAVATGDARSAQDTWFEYLSENVHLLPRDAADMPFDVVPIWRARGSEDGTPNTMAALIATEIRIRFAEGKLRNGNQLPPMPELAAEFGVSRPTMRECLRILEMESLVDLRTGSRSGAKVLEPTTETAAHLTTIVLASAQTRMADVAEAARLIEPPVMELVAARIDDEALADLSIRLQTLKDAVEQTPTFIELANDFNRHAYAAVQNPAMAVALEMLHWVHIECRRDLTISALSVPQVIRSNRHTCTAFEAFIAASKRRDVTSAGEAWADLHVAISPFFRSSFGDRLIVDLFD